MSSFTHMQNGHKWIQRGRARGKEEYKEKYRQRGEPQIDTDTAR